MSPQQSKRVVIPFEDNRVLPELVGPHDVNLILLEDRLGLSEIVAHGNLVTVVGSPEACANARKVLDEVYRRLTDGQSVSTGDVDGLARHVLGLPVLGDAEQLPDFITAQDSTGRPGKSGAAKSPAGLTRARSPAAGGSNPRPGRELVTGQVRTQRRTVNARTVTQTEYIKALHETDLVFGIGPAGTGKTYIAVAHGAARLERGEVEKLILSRPAVEAGERLGFLPGDMKDKVDPYLRPLYDALFDTLGQGKVEKAIETGVIEIAPLAFMRGRTLGDAVVILDEAQNCTVMQMKMFLTRLGENAQMIVTGDPTQIDLPPGQQSGLMDAVHRLTGIDEVSAVQFTQGDVVRRKLVGEIVRAYDGDNA
ncbi:MAG: PhoH family protein [Pseudomonadota bacterium]